jgi:hypothetical protein
MVVVGSPSGAQYPGYAAGAHYPAPAAYPSQPYGQPPPGMHLHHPQLFAPSFSHAAQHQLHIPGPGYIGGPPVLGSAKSVDSAQPGGAIELPSTAPYANGVADVGLLQMRLAQLQQEQQQLQQQPQPQQPQQHMHA